MKSLIVLGLLAVGAGWLVPEARGGVGSGAPDSPRTPLPDFAEFLRKEKGLSADAFLARYLPRPSAPDALGIDLAKVEYLDLIEKRIKPLPEAQPLSRPERAALSAQGLVILDSRAFPSFGHAFYDIYANDQPLFVTSDAMLHAFHKSFDLLLMELETTHLSPLLGQVLHCGIGGARYLREKAGDDAVVDQGARDVLFLFEVGRSLLEGATTHSDPDVDQVLRAVASERALDILFLGRTRTVDFSQFRPRGHYTKSEELKRYFRAMMWLGREDLSFHISDSFRETVAGFLMAASLERGGALPKWEEIDRLIGFLIGAPDGAGPKELLALLGKLGYTDFADFVRRAHPADTLARIGADKIGEQKIMSAIYLKQKDAPTFQLPKTAQMMGQRFTLDSFLFHELTFDRTQGAVARMMPQPLDFPAAMGQPRAIELLKSDLERHRHQENLAASIEYVRALPEPFWKENVYHGWLDALRELGATPPREAPGLLQTRAWAELKLHTQLGSWAQLRHDTILYTKQSYSTGVTCEYCDVVVEPVPAFFGKLGSLCERTAGFLREPSEASKDAKGLLKRYEAHFTLFAQTLARLGSIAGKLQAGTPIDAQERTFLRGVMEIKLKSRGCGGAEYFLSGWYPKLFPDAMESLAWDPTVADIHTMPTDEHGATVGRVLHVGVGNVNLAAFLMKGHDGVTRAYLGPIFSYYEVQESNFNRLTDEKWKERVGHPGARLGIPSRPMPPKGPAPQRPAWVKGLLGQ